MSSGDPRRRRVLTALLGGGAVLTALLLSRVLATVFFAITVAYVLVPLDRVLRRKGLSPWLASATTTLAAYLGMIAVLLPIGIILYVRRHQVRALLSAIPDRFELSVAGYAYAADLAELTAMVGSLLTRLAVDIARTTPVIAAKATVFGFVVFGLLLRRDRVRRALLSPVPERYHDVASALHGRVRDTLFALYVVQAATALGTFVVALAFFLAFGYPYPVMLAVLAGILQFLPVVGPSLVVAGVAAYEASVGALPRAGLVLVVGLVLVGVLPDAVLRPRLARRTARLPATLYFVGFAGGVLSLGPIGIIAGPLVVAVLAEVLALLADEMDADHATSRIRPE